MSGTLEKRFRRKCSQPTASGCIEWLGWKNNGGYGMIRAAKPPFENTLAHRVAYELYHGKIPAGLFVLHKCDNRACVNVEHLFLGTPQDNMDDMLAKDRQRRSKLDFDRVRDLRKHGLTQNEIALYFGVSRPLISMILSGRVRTSAMTTA